MAPGPPSRVLGLTAVGQARAQAATYTRTPEICWRGPAGHRHPHPPHGRPMAVAILRHRGWPSSTRCWPPPPTIAVDPTPAAPAPRGATHNLLRGALHRADGPAGLAQQVRPHALGVAGQRPARGARGEGLRVDGGGHHGGCRCVGACGPLWWWCLRVGDTGGGVVGVGLVARTGDGWAPQRTWACARSASGSRSKGGLRGTEGEATDATVRRGQGGGVGW